MTTYTSVSEFKEAILTELDTTNDINSTLRQTILDFIVYSEKKEKEEEDEAENRELRPRPFNEESTAYYRDLFEAHNILNPLRLLIEGLLELVEQLEQTPHN